MAADLADKLRKDGSIPGRDLTPDETAVFLELAVPHDGPGYQAQLWADGLLTYRHDAHEDAIEAGWKLASEDITRDYHESTAAWIHYMAALNILFLLVESSMHIGRSHDVFWIENVARTNVVRPRYDGTGNLVGEARFGPLTELGMARHIRTIPTRDTFAGSFQPSVVGAFADAVRIFDLAHCNPALWAFLHRYASAWTSHHLEDFDAALMIAWSLIERELVQRVAELLKTVAKGNLRIFDPRTQKIGPFGKESGFRNQIAAGESPMAGKLLAVLGGHGQTIEPEIVKAKAARDRLAHGGGGTSFSESQAALLFGRVIAKTRFSVPLATRVTGNPHIGMPP